MTADLLVAAERAAQESLDRQAELLGEEAAGGAGREQLVLRERAAVEARPGKEVGLAVVVRDQDDPLATPDAPLTIASGHPAASPASSERRPPRASRRAR
jgi:hypothetical protein